MDKTGIADTFPGSPPVASVVRLGPLRWHLRLGASDGNHRREVYLSPGDGGLLYATRTGNRLAIRLHGPLGDACVRNLGDCLLNALCEGVDHIDLWPGLPGSISPDAGPMFESFGRSLARSRLCLGLKIHDPDPGLKELAEAFRQGLAQAGKPNGTL
jgi:hypothetical protein